MLSRNSKRELSNSTPTSDSQHLGNSPGAAFYPFEMDATAAAKPGKNTLVICVSNQIVNELGTGGLVAPVLLYAPAAGKDAKLENLLDLKRTFPLRQSGAIALSVNLQAPRGRILFKLHDLRVVVAKQRFDERGCLVATPQPDELGRMPSQKADVVVVRVESDNYEAVQFGVLPDDVVVRCSESQKSRLRRVGKHVRQFPHQLVAQMMVKQQLHASRS